MILFNRKEFLVLPIVAFSLVICFFLPLIFPSGLRHFIIFFITSILISYWSILRFSDWANPIMLFVIPWLLELGLFQLGLMSLKAQGTLEYSTYVLILVSIISFIMGCLIKLFPQKTKLNLNKYWDFAKVRTAIFFSFLFGVLVSLYCFNRAGGLKVMLHDPEYYRLHFTSPFIDDIYRLVPLCGILCIYYLAKGIKKYRFVVFIISICSFLLVVMRISRAGLFQFIIIALITYNLVKPVRLRKVFVILVLMFVMFVGIQYWRGSQFVKEASYINQGLVNVSKRLPWAAALSIYTIPNIRNIQIAMNTYHQLEYGKNTLLPIWAFTFTKSVVGVERHDTAYKQKLFGLGVFQPYLIDFYKDFGMLGFLLLPFMIGLISSYFYDRAVTTKAPFNIIIYSVISFCLIFSFVSNFFSDTGVWVLIIYTTLVHLFCKKRIPQMKK